MGEAPPGLYPLADRPGPGTAGPFAHPVPIRPWRDRYLLCLSGWFLHVVLDVCANWEVPVLWPVSQDRWALHLLERDFSWPIDMLLVVGLASTLWQPAMRHARILSIATAALLALWLVAGLPT